MGATFQVKSMRTSVIAAQMNMSENAAGQPWRSTSEPMPQPVMMVEA